MSKSIIDAPLTTRAARSRLDAGLHWRSIDPDTHLGYRRSKRAGRWLARWRIGTGYKQATLASADDVLDADGVATLSFDQAVRVARLLVQTARAAKKAIAAGPIQTVRVVAEHYAGSIEARQRAAGRAISRDCRSRFTKHVFGDAIAELPLHRLAASDLRAWRDRIRAKLPRRPGIRARTFLIDFRSSFGMDLPR